MLIGDDIQKDFRELIGNPTVQVTSLNVRKTYEFPDHNSYFVLSGVGKYYHFVTNDTVALLPNRGYLNNPFSLDSNHVAVISMANQLFGGTKQLPKEAVGALKYALNKNRKTSPSLSNRS